MALPWHRHTFELAPGLRLQATAPTGTWLYRYKSPVDDRMRQVRLGHWPAMSAAAALVAWQQAREARAAGADIASRRRSDRSDERLHATQPRKARAQAVFTVRCLADDYLPSYKGTVEDKTFRELESLFAREPGPIASRPAAKLTRTEAFTAIEAMRHRPVVARRVRQGLGAAWDHALDAGRLQPETPNWWRPVLRGKPS